MSDLKIIDVYENNDDKQNDKFLDNVESRLRIKFDYENTIFDTEWIELMTETLPYIDNIFRNPNRFIVNNEEIVKIEQSKKISVESIKHLSKHTNFIQDVNEKTGDVIPGKILNAFKEETYLTYENKLIYTLVQNMKFFVFQKKERLMEYLHFENKNDKKIEYTAGSSIDNEKININLSLNSSLEKSQNSNEEVLRMLDEIAALERKITDFTSTEVYKILDQAKFALIRNPIKKTNVVLKNVNFQYAVKLWNYLNDNLDDKTKNEKEVKDYYDEGFLKQLIDETFLLDYLAVSTLNQKDEEETEEKKKKITETIITLLLNKMVDVDDTLSEDNIKNMVGEKYAVIKLKHEANIQELQKIFKEHIENYIKQLP